MVQHFKAYPKGDRILFTATERSTTAPAELNAKLLFDQGTGASTDGSAQAAQANIWSLALAGSKPSPKVVAVGTEPQWLP